MAPTGVTVTRPEGFDLSQVWQDIAATVDELRLPARVRALADPSMLGVLRQVFGPRLTVGPAGADKRVELEIRGWVERSLAVELAGFGPWVEVVSPASVRHHLAGIGAALLNRYGGDRPE